MPNMAMCAKSGTKCGSQYLQIELVIPIIPIPIVSKYLVKADELVS